MKTLVRQYNDSAFTRSHSTRTSVVPTQQTLSPVL